MSAPWIVAHFPPHRAYVEPFAGAASVLLRKDRSHSELLNDLDGEVVNLFRVLRSPELSSRLVDSLRLTPFAREEFEASYEAVQDPLERARRLIIRSFMGFGSDSGTRKHRTGFRSKSPSSGTAPARDWANYPEALLAVIERLTGVAIENRPALEVIQQHDAPDVLFYLDPPYLWSERSGQVFGETGIGYRHEMTEDQHRDMLECLCRLKGMVVVSGYQSLLYDEALPDWTRVQKQAVIHGGDKRIETLWLNPSAMAHLGPVDLFALSGQHEPDETRTGARKGRSARL